MRGMSPCRRNQRRRRSSARCCSRAPPARLPGRCRLHLRRHPGGDVLQEVLPLPTCGKRAGALRRHHCPVVHAVRETWRMSVNCLPDAAKGVSWGVRSSPNMSLREKVASSDSAKITSRLGGWGLGVVGATRRAGFGTQSAFWTSFHDVACQPNDQAGAFSARRRAGHRKIRPSPLTRVFARRTLVCKRSLVTEHGLSSGDWSRARCRVGPMFSWHQGGFFGCHAAVLGPAESPP